MTDPPRPLRLRRESNSSKPALRRPASDGSDDTSARRPIEKPSSGGKGAGLAARKTSLMKAPHSPLQQELEAVAHRLVQRHGTLVRLLHSAFYAGSGGPLRGQEARFELLIVLEDLTHRPSWVDLLSRLDLESDGGDDVTVAFRRAIHEARTLDEQVEKLIRSLDILYLRAFGPTSIR